MHTRDAVGIGAPQGATTGAGLSRREFLAAGGIGAAWALLSSPGLAAMGASAREAAARGDAFVNLTAAQGRTLAALLDRIIPAVDGLPGATEAGAGHFADLALGGPLASARKLVAAGLADLDTRARVQQSQVAGFAQLPAAEQDRLLHTVDRTAFFSLASTLAIFGTLSTPEHGGNRNGVGWKLVQIEQRMRWQPPFGWYDAQWTHAHPEAAS